MISVQSAVLCEVMAYMCDSMLANGSTCEILQVSDMGTNPEI